MPQPVLLFGAGAIGSTAGAYMARAGTPVLLVDRNRPHIEAIRSKGLRIEGPRETFTVRLDAVLPDELQARNARYGETFLCVKSLDTTVAARALAPCLAPDGWVVSLQNGLNEEAIEAEVGTGRVVPAFVNFSADLLSPGVIHYAGASALVVGETDHRVTPRLRRIVELLAPLQTVEMSEQVDGYLWSKQAYGAMLFATAMTNATMYECVEHSRYRPVLLAVAAESIALARAQGIPMFAFDGWDPNAVGDSRAEAQMMDALARVMRANSKVRSGIWRDLAVHRRKTEVDEFLPLFALADRLGVAMPLSRLMVDIIHDLEQGVQDQGLHQLEKLLVAARTGA